MNKFGVWAVVLLLPGLAACSPALDTDQARLCRSALPALADPDARITVTRQSLLPATGSDDQTGVRIDYQSAISDNPPRSDFAECRFGGGSSSTLRLDLVALRSRSGALRGDQLMLLQRFWLTTAEAMLHDPLPLRGASTAVELPFGLAYGLQQAVSALPLAAIYGLLAAAYSLLYGLIGRVNMAFGEFAAVGGYAALIGALAAGGHSALAVIALACGLALFASAVHGIAAGRLLLPVLQRSQGQQTLIATIGLALFLQEYLRLSQGAALRWVSPILAEPVALAKSGAFIVTVTPIALLSAGLAALTASALLALMHYSQFGRNWRACADDAGAAALVGVNPAAVLRQTFALACALAGLSGAIITLYYGSFGYGSATQLGLKALVAAILGGIGSLPGAFAGGLAIGALEALWSALFPSFYRDIMVYGLLAVLLILRPGGLFGQADISPRRV